MLFPIDNNMREIDFYKFGSVLNFNRVVTTRPYETLSGFGRLTLDLTWFDLHASRYLTLDCAPRFALELRSCHVESSSSFGSILRFGEPWRFALVSASILRRCLH